MATESFDACWQTIGIQGDRSCERLERHVHCRNCERYTDAAMHLLDRYTVGPQPAANEIAPQGAPTLPTDSPSAESQGSSALVFRVGSAWFAVRTDSLLAVCPSGAVHSLPHRRSRVLLGICNVDGALVPCISLAALLAVETVPDMATPAHAPQGTGAAPGQQGVPRVLVFRAAGGPVVTSVSEIDGVYRLPLAQITQTFQQTGLPTSQLARGAMQWQGRSLTLLDEERLAAALLRSLK